MLSFSRTALIVSLSTVKNLAYPSVAAGADGLGMISAGASLMVYSAGLSNEWTSYVVGVRLMSDGLDLRGRLAFAHRAALSLTCFAIHNEL